MVILIAGPSHTGKTALAQTLLERYRYPVFSLDLLKMGLIRSGQTELTPEDDDALVPYLWGIAAETIKTAIENGQNLIVEGCYIPFDWQSSFEARYLESIAYCCLVMSQDYLARHHADIRRFANIAESRLYDDIDFDELARDNERALAACRSKGLPFCLIDGEYRVAEWEVAPLSERGTKEAAVLFLETVHAVNSRDYSPSQISAWAPGDEASQRAISAKLAGERTVGVRECGILIGFGSLNDAGDVDMLYVHKDRQRQGVARRVLRELEAVAAAGGASLIGADASLIAQPFFARMGYSTVREQTVVRRGVELRNFRMAKQL